jgi:hypothetical protein
VANARLIAAAPDLLEACDRLTSIADLWQCEQEPGTPHREEMRAALDQALAAMAKATGKEG